ncbi:MAG: WD40/YVTN/BNR-like repeat-containing protein, partial [Candidatus Eiseniibacteriota bacterium]
LRSDSAAAPGSWRKCAGLPDGLICGLSLDRSSPARSRTLFVADNGQVYRSRDDGWNWERVFDAGVCRITAVDRFDGRLVYAGGEGGLWRSSHGGEPGSWESIGSSEMSGAPTQSADGFRWPGVHAIVPDPGTAGRLYVVSFGDGRGLYRSDDQGRHWSKLRAGAFCRELAIDPADPRRLYLTSSRAYKSGGRAEGSEGVLRSADGGRSWTPWNQGLAWPFAGPIVVNAGLSGRAFVGSPGNGFFRRSLP